MKTDIKLKQILICYSFTITFKSTCTMSQNEVTFVEEENFKSLVCRRLVECGWMDEVTMLCKEKLKDRLSKGQTLQSITEDDLFNDVAPDARRMLPDTIKRELKVKVQNKLLQTAGYFDETDTES